jgi:hypothetical protein
MERSKPSLPEAAGQLPCNKRGHRRQHEKPVDNSVESFGVRLMQAPGRLRARLAKGCRTAVDGCRIFTVIFLIIKNQ